MPLGPDDGQAADGVDRAVFRLGRLTDFRDTGTQFDVGAPAGHVRGYRNGSQIARSGHDFRFALMLLGVQHLVLEPPALEHAGHLL